MYSHVVIENYFNSGEDLDTNNWMEAALQLGASQVWGYFLVFVQLFEKYGTLIERYTALIEKVSALIGAVSV